MIATVRSFCRWVHAWLLALFEPRARHDAEERLAAASEAIVHEIDDLMVEIKRNDHGELL